MGDWRLSLRFYSSRCALLTNIMVYASAILRLDTHTSMHGPLYGIDLSQYYSPCCAIRTGTRAISEALYV